VPAEKRYELLSQSQAECVLVRAFQEERTFFRKEKWEAREIDLAGIDLCFGEVGIDGEHGDELRRHFPRQLAPCTRLPFSWTHSIKARRFSSRVWSQFNAFSLLKLTHSFENAGAAEVIQERIKRGRGPAQPGATATRNEALNVESPFVPATGKTQRARRDHDFSRPAISRSCRTRIPNPIPIEGDIFQMVNQAIDTATRGIHLEVVTVP